MEPEAPITELLGTRPLQTELNLHAIFCLNDFAYVIQQCPRINDPDLKSLSGVKLRMSFVLITASVTA